jgi:hypothetical protein
MAEPRECATRDTRQPPATRNRQSTARPAAEVRKRCCANCVYACRPRDRWFRVLMSRSLGLLICVNCAAAPGEMRGVPATSVCRNFRPRRDPPLRLAPPDPPNDRIRYIALTKGKHAIVDAEDYDRLAQHKWMAFFTCGNWYASRAQKGKCILMHRQIMNPPRGLVVDHINGNGLDNRRCNLRICTYGQNSVHRRPRGDSSRFKCVYRDEKRNLWRSTPFYRGRSVYNGRYASEIDAARASDYMNVQLNGEFAYLNFPAEWPKQRIQEVYARGQSLREKLRAIGDKRQERGDK